MKLKQIAFSSLVVVALACKKEAPTDGASGASPADDAAAALGKVKSVGRAHLPAGCEIVATLDFQRFRNLKSVRANLDKELDQLTNPQPTDPVDPKNAEDLKKFREFLAKTHIDVKNDPGEVAVCAWNLAGAKGDQAPPFVAVLGGNFIPGAAMDALDSFSERIKGFLERVRASKGASKTPPEMLEIGGVKTAFDKEQGLYFAQAKDGAFVVGNDRPSFEKALVPSKTFEAYSLPSEPIGVSLDKSAAPLVAPQLAQSPFAPAAASFGGGSLGYDEGRLRLQVKLLDEKLVPALESSLNAFLKPPPGTPVHPMMASLADAKIVTAGPVLTLDLPLPEEATQGLLRQTGMGPAQVRPGAPPGALVVPAPSAPAAPAPPTAPAAAPKK